MIDGLLFALTLLAAFGCGLVAGVFFAFSTFVMQALARLPPAQGIAAMQSINLVVLGPWFMTAFFGTAAACALLTATALASWSRPGAVHLLAGSLLYLTGAILVTILCNVPRNRALTALDPDSPDGPGRWAGYVAGWMAWNHVRTAAALAAAALFTLALR